MSERDLDELLARIDVPTYDVRDDVARGQGALRRRNVALSAAGMTLPASVGTALLLGGTGSPVTSPQYAAPPSVSTTPQEPSPSASASSEPPVVLTSPEAGALPPANYEEAAPVLRAW